MFCPKVTAANRFSEHILLPLICVRMLYKDSCMISQYRPRTPRLIASLLITGVGRFPQILDLFRVLKTGVPSGCLGESRRGIKKLHNADDEPVDWRSSYGTYTGLYIICIRQQQHHQQQHCRNFCYLCLISWRNVLSSYTYGSLASYRQKGV